MNSVSIVSHPLILHKLSILRERSTPSVQFRLLLKEISMLLAYEATKDFSISSRSIETPLEKMEAPTLSNEHPVLVSILRAGNGLLDGTLEIIPSAKVGFIGIYRDPNTLQAVEYYCNLPKNIKDNELILLDPMLATGHSAIAAINKIKEQKPKRIKLINLLAAPEGIQTLNSVHPDVEIFAAAVDRELNDHGYIMPGLGDAGDRLFGTK